MSTTTVTDGLSMRQYLAIDAESSSGLKPALVSRDHYLANKRSPRAATVDMKMGTALHGMLLTPRTLHEEVVEAPEAATTRNTKVYKEFADGTPDHVEVLLASEMDAVRMMAARAKADPFVGGILGQVAGTERTCEWMEGKRPAKMRVDAWLELPDGVWLLDVKSCQNATRERLGANRPFQATSWDFLYHMQLAWYRRGWQACIGPVQGALILAVEKNDPYACRVYDVTGQLEDGDRLIDRALAEINEPAPRGIETLPKPSWAQYQ